MEHVIYYLGTYGIVISQNCYLASPCNADVRCTPLAMLSLLNWSVDRAKTDVGSKRPDSPCA